MLNVAQVISPYRTIARHARHQSTLTAPIKVLNPEIALKKKKGLRKIKNVDEVPLKPTQAFTAPSNTDSKRVTAFSTAESYNFRKLELSLKVHYEILPEMDEDVIRVRFSDVLSGPEQAEAFIFSNGTFCTWGSSPAQTDHLMEHLKGSQSNPYTKIETEYFDYFSDPNLPGGMTMDDIVLGSDLPVEQAKLVYASGMTRSVKLASLEELLNLLLERNKAIPEMLQHGQKLTLDRQQNMRNLGELFSLRCTFLN